MFCDGAIVLSTRGEVVGTLKFWPRWFDEVLGGGEIGGPPCCCCDRCSLLPCCNGGDEAKAGAIGDGRVLFAMSCPRGVLELEGYDPAGDWYVTCCGFSLPLPLGRRDDRVDCGVPRDCGGFRFISFVGCACCGN